MRTLQSRAYKDPGYAHARLCRLLGTSEHPFESQPGEALRKGPARNSITLSTKFAPPPPPLFAKKSDCPLGDSESIAQGLSKPSGYTRVEGKGWAGIEEWVGVEFPPSPPAIRGRTLVAAFGPHSGPRPLIS